MTKLFEKSETRGIDASGFWGVEKGVDGSVVFHKEPGRSSQFVKKDVWRSLASHELNVLIVHARGASKGVGEPAVNSNNHPFTNSDRSLALIHNGRVDDVEYQALRNKYEVRSNCDSEIILRIIENPDGAVDMGKELYPHRLAGISDVFSLINEGHMAVALGERGVSGDRMLWLFRNQFRPLWVADLREQLGQVFFFSEPSIWEEAVHECGQLKPLLKSQKLIELPFNQVWYFRLTEDVSAPQATRFQVAKDVSEPWVFDGRIREIKSYEPTFHVITELNESDECRRSKPSGKATAGEFNLDSVEKKCDEIIDVLNNIKQYAEQLVNEQSITKAEFDELLFDLELKRKELESISTIINR